MATKAVQGVQVGGYSVSILGGQHYTTAAGNYAEMADGTEYKLELANNQMTRCSVYLEIDGYHMGTWQLDGNQTATLERPANVAKKFTFYRVKDAPEGSGIQRGRSKNGLVFCRFSPEKEIKLFLHASCDRNNPTKEIEVPRQGKELHLANAVFETLGMAATGNHVILWSETGNRPIVVRQTVHNKFEEDSSYEIPGNIANVYVISACTPVKIKVKNKEPMVWEYDRLYPLGYVIDKITNWLKCEWWQVSLTTEAGRNLFAYDSFDALQNTESSLLCSFTREEFLTMACRREFTLKVSVDETISSMVVYIQTLTNKTIELEIPTDSLVETLKEAVLRKEGIPTSQQRLIYAGQQLENGRRLRYYKIFHDTVLHLVLRLRGGGDPTASWMQIVGRTNTSSQSQGTSSSDWVSGATTLQSPSSQEFRSVEPLAVDKRKTVEISVRLVTRRDGESERSNTDEMTPLKVAAAGPPVPDD